MSDTSTFTETLRRIRAGDEEAAAEIVRQYEPLVRREVRLQLGDQRMRRVFDSMDVCQSVLASFFVRAAAGQFDLRGPQQLVKLLITMSRNKLISAARRQRQQKRDHRKLAESDSDLLHQVVGSAPSPSAHLAGKELLERVQAELSEEEKQIVELRSQGLEWAAIAEQMGGKAQARRMQLARALDRVAQSLGLEEDLHE